MSNPKAHTVLPLQVPHLALDTRRSWARKGTAVAALVALGLAAGFLALGDVLGRGAAKRGQRGLAPFFSQVNTHDDLCVGGVSHSGYIGLKGDSVETPKRSFFWYFEAQNSPETAPVILTIGGGPGTSGMLNPLFGQSHCAVTQNLTTERNPNAWSENFNVVALDHPVGVGFSYGTHVNNSVEAAYDAYDFLVKFMSLFPHLAKNQLVLAGGSYGGVYIPHIATVIHEQNTLLARRGGKHGAVHLQLESMMVSNPMSDYLSHNRWLLQQRCYHTDLYNASTCATAYEALPFCLEAVQLAYTLGTVEARVHALELCEASQIEVPGRSLENVEKRCNGTIEDCVPESVRAVTFMNLPSTKATLGARGDITFRSVDFEVNREFHAAGDECQQAHLLYEPLLAAGYRLLHYIGKLDANCAWPGVLSTLKLIRSQHQPAFAAAPDVPWAGEDATLRVVGPGAGNFTYVLMGGAGHFVTHDQPALVKRIVGRWVGNVPFQ